MREGYYCNLITIIWRRTRCNPLFYSLANARQVNSGATLQIHIDCWVSFTLHARCTRRLVDSLTAFYAIYNLLR